MPMPAIPPLVPSVRAYKSAAGKLTGFRIGSTNYPMNLTARRNRCVFLGNSLTQQASGRAVSVFNGTLWMFSTSFVNTNFGGNNAWIQSVQISGNAGTTASTLHQDGAGNLSFAYSTDSLGTPINVAKGGWFVLNSGTPGTFPQQLLVLVRGATTPPSVAGSGTVTGAGHAVINDWAMFGYASWVAGQMRDAFNDYETWGITGANTSDILLYCDQAWADDCETTIIEMGTNDFGGLGSGETAAALRIVTALAVSNIKATIQKAISHGIRRIYVLDMDPYPGVASALIAQYMMLTSTIIQEYCKTLTNVRFVSSWDLVVSATASYTSSITAKTGCFFTDNEHYMPYGAYLKASRVVTSLQQDYPVDYGRRVGGDTYDTTLQYGSFNTNSTLRGTAGTVQTSAGITGTAPDGWFVYRSGSTQTLTTSFTAATDNGISWFTMSVASATSADYHGIEQATVSVPSGFTTGMYFRLVCEWYPGAMTGNGLATFIISAVGNANGQAAYLIQLPTTGKNINTFTGSEGISLFLQSEPQQLISGTTSFNVGIQVGADSGASSTAVINIRNLRLEPYYPNVAVYPD